MDTSVLLSAFQEATLLHVVSFVFGMLCGWIMRILYIARGGKSETFSSIVQFTIFVLWALATFRAAFFDVPYPPLSLNIAFGVVLGTLNRRTGDYIIQILDKVYQSKP